MVPIYATLTIQIATQQTTQPICLRTALPTSTLKPFGKSFPNSHHFFFAAGAAFLLADA